MAAEEDRDPAVLLAQITDCISDLLVGFSEKGDISHDICTEGEI